jgi:hypothetical protein
MTWLCYIGDWIAEHVTVISAVISAIATGFIALFTTKLTGATVGLRAAADQQHLDTVEALRLTREALAFTRDEFNATHRPELLIREVTWEMVDMDGGEVVNDDAITFALVNRGRNSCTIVESAFEYRATPPDGRALPTGAANLHGGVSLAAGEFGHFKYEINSENESFVAGARTLNDTYFRGTIIYEDRASVRRRYVFILDGANQTRSESNGDRHIGRCKGYRGCHPDSGSHHQNGNKGRGEHASSVRG